MSITKWMNNEDVRNRIAKTIGTNFDADFFVEQLLIAFQNPILANCTPDSMFKAAHTCAALGMLPTLQHVALIPRKVRDKSGTVLREECTVMPQWQGLQAMMLRHPDIKWIQHSLVHPSDVFHWDGTSQSVTHHEYDPFEPARMFRDTPDVRGGYLKITFVDDRPPVYHVVTADAIFQARKCAQSDDIWSKWFEQQAIKTLYRNGFARRVVPIDPMINQSRIQAAIEQEDAVLENDPSRIESASKPPAIEVRKPASRAAVISQRKPSQPKEPVPEPVEYKQQEQSVFAGTKQMILNAKTTDELQAVTEILQADNTLTDAEFGELQTLLDQTAEVIQSGG
jgi:recombinational DNA repair protein RecT